MPNARRSAQPNKKVVCDGTDVNHKSRDRKTQHAVTRHITLLTPTRTTTPPNGALAICGSSSEANELSTAPTYDVGGGILLRPQSLGPGYRYDTLTRLVLESK